MIYDMQNPLWETNPKEAKEGFEKELRERVFSYCKEYCNWGKEYCDNINCSLNRGIREILGETTT